MSDTPAKEAAPKAKKAAPEPPTPGPVATKLKAAGFTVETLAPDATGKEVLRLAAEQVTPVCTWLRDEAGFDSLVSASGMDHKTHRETVYHLFGTDTHEFLVLKIAANEQDRAPSLMPIWHAADWHERESYDLVGIIYEGHSDLRRILMPNYWLGHPLRKDYVENDPRLVWNHR
jgi:NADH:ubiquinone oxidoreductase subunit C